VKLKSLVCLAAFVAAGYAHGQALENGTHYRLISPAQSTSSDSGKIEVAEFFQYGCPGCYSLEPHVNEWKTNLMPEGVNLVRVHVVWSPLARLHAQAFYAAEALGKLEEIHPAFFDEFHRARNTLDTEQKLAEFFGRFGVSADAFNSAFKSFAVHTKLQRAEELTRRYGVSETPTLVVQGKYATEGRMMSSYGSWFETINRIVEMERAAQ
jgi:thiol:disulfide interchange protein DsbA